MATDFSNKAVLGKPVYTGSKALSDLPLDVRTRIETISEMELIEYPYIGMLVYVKDEDKYYIVKSIKGGEVFPGFAPSYEEGLRIDEYENFTDRDIIIKNKVFDTTRDADDYTYNSKSYGEILHVKDYRTSNEKYSDVNIYEEPCYINRSRKATPICSFSYSALKELFDILYDLNNKAETQDNIDELKDLIQPDFEYVIDYKKQPWNPEAYIGTKMFVFKMASEEDCENLILQYYESYADYPTDLDKEIVRVERNGITEYYVIFNQYTYRPSSSNQITPIYIKGTANIEEMIYTPLNENTYGRFNTYDLDANSINNIIESLPEYSYNSNKFYITINEIIDGKVSMDDINLDLLKEKNITAYIYKTVEYTFTKNTSEFFGYIIPEIEPFLADHNNWERVIEEDINSANSLTTITILGAVPPTSVKFNVDYCDHITNVAYVNTECLEDAEEMFKGCSGLTAINGIENWNTSKIKNMCNMFYECEKLEHVDTSNWDMSSVTDTSGMFFNCYKLKGNIDFSGQDFSKNKSYSYMFCQCYLIEEINFDNVTWPSSLYPYLSVSSMFDGCKKLKSLNLNSFIAHEIESLDGLFCYCEQLEYLDLSNWNLGEYPDATTNSDYIFDFTRKLTLNNLILTGCPEKTKTFLTVEFQRRRLS